MATVHILGKPVTREEFDDLVTDMSILRHRHGLLVTAVAKQQELLKALVEKAAENAQTK